MHKVFLDTNALIKLFVPEVGSSWLTNYVADKEIIISELALIESATVLRRRFQEGFFTRPHASALYARIQRESRDYIIVPINSTLHINRLISLAFNLPANFRIRALDAIHLAAASVEEKEASNKTPADVFTFVSSDLQLLRAVQALGIAIENPEIHP